MDASTSLLLFGSSIFCNTCFPLKVVCYCRWDDVVGPVIDKSWHFGVRRCSKTENAVQNHDSEDQEFISKTMREVSSHALSGHLGHDTTGLSGSCIVRKVYWFDDMLKLTGSTEKASCLVYCLIFATPTSLHPQSQMLSLFVRLTPSSGFSCDVCDTLPACGWKRSMQLFRDVEFWNPLIQSYIIPAIMLFRFGVSVSSSADQTDELTKPIRRLGNVLTHLNFLSVGSLTSVSNGRAISRSVIKAVIASSFIRPYIAALTQSGFRSYIICPRELEDFGNALAYLSFLCCPTLGERSLCTFPATSKEREITTSFHRLNQYRPGFNVQVVLNRESVDFPVLPDEFVRLSRLAPGPTAVLHIIDPDNAKIYVTNSNWVEFHSQREEILNTLVSTKSANPVWNMIKPFAFEKSTLADDLLFNLNVSLMSISTDITFAQLNSLLTEVFEDFHTVLNFEAMAMWNYIRGHAKPGTGLKMTRLLKFNPVNTETDYMMLLGFAERTLPGISLNIFRSGDKKS